MPSHTINDISVQRKTYFKQTKYKSHSDKITHLDLELNLTEISFSNTTQIFSW